MNLVKKQVYLTSDQELALRRRAEAEGVSDAELVRRALDAYLEAGPTPQPDPMLDLIGAFVAEDGHHSGTVDRDLYGGEPGAEA